MDPEILEYYSERFREDDRLRASARGVLERARTQELISRFLPAAPASVLDVGGASGVHAEWLAARGYQVHVVDPVPAHVTQAGSLVGVSAEMGDARALSQPDSSQDVVLLLGPLYHLLERRDRLRALQEAYRVTRPGAPVFAAGISRYSALIDIGSDGRLTEEVVPFISDLHATGVFRSNVVGFTTAYFHLPEQLRDEVTEAGFENVEIYGIEGPAGPTLRALGMNCLDERLDAALRAARLVERNPALLAASGHLLAIGNKPT